jgi:tetratricopeptide (TPR) repeat protein
VDWSSDGVKLVTIDFGILGRTALRIGGDLDWGWGTPRIRAMVAALLVHAGRPVSVDALLAWVWPDEDALPQNPTATFYTYATRIRKILQHVVPPSALRAENGSYCLDVEKSLIDYGQFQIRIVQARERARAEDYQNAVDLADSAIALWRGRALDDLSSEPAKAWRLRVLRDDWIPANIIYIQALLEIGDFDRALSRLDDLKADYDEDVTLAKLRLSTLQRLARYPDATAYYMGMRRLFRENADDQAAEDLRAHYENLRVTAEQVRVGAFDEVDVLSPRQLPHDTAHFVGREHLLHELDTAARGEIEDAGGVVVIEGMAGVGKTTLAIRWAHRVRHFFPGGHFFVNLNGFSDGRSVPHATVVDEFLMALGQSPSPDLMPRAKELLLSRLLSQRRSLVVLDNAQSTDHIKNLIPLMSNSFVIVTSRQQLTKLSTRPGVRHVRVDPLASGEATTLFSELLGAQHRPDSDSWRLLVSLCGGLPLVITVLAQHIASRPAADVTEFARQLDLRRLITEVGEDGDGSAAAATFFLWSYESLAPPEKRLFRVLGLNPALDIAEEVVQVCDGRSIGEVRRSLRVLVAAHLLVQPDSFDRYRFHDLIREFARHRAELEESAESRATLELRLLDYYLATAMAAHRKLYPGNLMADDISTTGTATSVNFDDNDQARAWFDRERRNLTAIVHFAAAAGHHEHAWRVTDTLATFLDRRGYYEDSRSLRVVALDSARAVGSRVGETSTAIGLGMVQMVLGDLTHARQNFESALHIVDNERGQASALHHLGRLELMRGNHADAVAYYQRCLDIAERMQDSEALCWTHYRIGEALSALNQHDEALVHLHQGQFHAQSLEDKSASAAILVQTGFVYRSGGDLAAAAAHCERAFISVETSPTPDLAILTAVCIALAEIRYEQHDIESATGHILHAVELAQRTHNAAMEARAYEVYGDIQFHVGEPTYTQTREHAADLYDRLGNFRQASLVRSKAHR